MKDKYSKPNQVFILMLLVTIIAIIAILLIITGVVVQ
jgi:hypothetical protein